MVEFCPKCGNMMIPRRKEGRVILVCPKCGYTKENSVRTRILSKKIIHKETERTFVIDTEDMFKGVPKTRGVKCPKCGNDEAYYVILQTRRADEPPTRIYKCTKCGHVWREYE